MDLAKIIRAIEIGIENTAKLKSRHLRDAENFSHYGNKASEVAIAEMCDRNLSNLREAKEELISAQRGTKDNK